MSAATATTPDPTNQQAMRLAQLLDHALGAQYAAAAQLPTTEAAGTAWVRDITADSRQVRPGSLFVAVTGTNADGQAYVSQAVERGAVGVIGEAEPSAAHRVPYVRVTDSRRALARLAAHFRGLARVQAAGGMKVIGVTGTNGKSTTTFMLRSLLRAMGMKSALLGTIEYDLVGRTLASALTTPDPITLTQHLMEAHAAGATHAVMEVSSHSLDQRRTDGLTLSAGVFTNLTQDHLDYHKTLENYLAAKRRLFEQLGPSAVAVVNADDPRCREIVEGCQMQVVTYGLGSQAGARALIREEGRSGARFTLSWEGRELELTTPLVGRHNVYNALAAAVTGLSLGLDEAAVCRGLAELSHVPGRLQQVAPPSAGFDVFVDYAHTEDALRNVLSAVRPLVKGKLWCVFGCGGERDRVKRPRMGRAVAAGADAFIVTSDNPRGEEPRAIIDEILQGLGSRELSRAIVEPDRKTAIGHAISSLQPGDLLLIAGKGHEDYQDVGGKKIHFDDVEIAAAALLARGIRNVPSPPSAVSARGGAAGRAN